MSLFLFLTRAPFLLFFSAIYFLLLEWAPLGQTVKYATLWMMLSIPGVWWVDLQVDGVRRGYVTLVISGSIWYTNHNIASFTPPVTTSHEPAQ